MCRSILFSYFIAKLQMVQRNPAVCFNFICCVNCQFPQNLESHSSQAKAVKWRVKNWIWLMNFDDCNTVLLFFSIFFFGGLTAFFSIGNNDLSCEIAAWSFKFFKNLKNLFFLQLPHLKTFFKCAVFCDSLRLIKTKIIFRIWHISGYGTYFQMAMMLAWQYRQFRRKRHLHFC